MAISGLTATADNGIQRITSSQTALSAGVITDETVVVQGASTRIWGEIAITRATLLFRLEVANSNILSYADTNEYDITNSVDVNDSHITVETTSASSRRVRISTADNLTVVGKLSSGTGTPRVFVYIAPSGTFNNVTIANCYVFEVLASSSRTERVTLENTALGMLNFYAGDFYRVGISVPSSTTGFLSWLGQGDTGTATNTFHDINPVNFNPASIAMENANARAYVYYTASWIFRDSAGLVQDALLIWQDNRTGSNAERGRYTTNASGKLVGTVDSRTLTSGSNIERATLVVMVSRTVPTGSSVSTGLASPATHFTYNVVAVTTRIGVRSYRHLDVPIADFAIASPIGNYSGSFVATEFGTFALDIDPGVTQSNTTTVAAYTGLSYNAGTNTLTISAVRTISEIYDWLKLQWRENDGRPVPTMQGAIADFANINLAVSGVTLPASIKFSGGIRTTGTATFSSGGTALYPVQTSAGTRVKVTAPNLEDGTRVRLYNLTDSVEIDNSLVSGGAGYIYTINWTADKTVHFKAVKVSGATAKNYIDATGILTNTGLSFLNSQTDNVFYNEIAIDGSTITEFAADFANVQIDVDDADGQTSVQRAYAWYVYTMSTTTGIRAYNNALQPQGDIFNYLVVNAAINPLQVENTGVLPCTIRGGIIKRDDGESIIAATSNTIVIEPDRVYAYAGSGTAPTAAENATAVWGATIRSLTDKSGYALTSDERTAIASAVDTALDDEFTTVNNAISNLPAPDNAGITAIATVVGNIPTNPLLANDGRLDNLDATISSRAQPSDVAVTVSGGFGDSDRTKLNAIPSNPLLTNDSRLDAIATRASQDSVNTLATAVAGVPAAVNSALSDEFTAVLAAIASIEMTAPTAAQIRVELDNNAIFAGNIRDLRDFRGLTPGQAMTVNETTGTITVNGKTLTRTVSGNTITYTRT